jgi:hypothetical protein
MTDMLASAGLGLGLLTFVQGYPIREALASKLYRENKGGRYVCLWMFMCKEWQAETEINERETEWRMREDMRQQNACVFLYRKTCYTGCGNLAEYLAGEQQQRLRRN